jgi:hypothetical protein
MNVTVHMAEAPDIVGLTDSCDSFLKPNISLFIEATWEMSFKF